MKKLAVISFIFVLVFNAYSQKTVYDFELPDLQNRYTAFSELKGEQLTIIDFWASWCKPCVNSIPELASIYNDFSEKGVEVIGINIDGPRNQSKVKPMGITYGINYPVLLDPDMDILTGMGFNSIPALVISDAENNILYTHQGFKKGDEIILRQKIEKFLANE